MRALAVLVLAVFFAVVAAIVTVPIAMPALIIGMNQGTDWWDVVSQRGFWTTVAIMSLLAAVRGQRQFGKPPRRRAPRGHPRRQRR